MRNVHSHAITTRPNTQSCPPVCTSADSCLASNSKPFPLAPIAMDPAFTYGLIKGTAGAPHLDPGPAALDIESGAYGKLKVTQLTTPLYEYVLDRTDEPQVSGKIVSDPQRGMPSCCCPPDSDHTSRSQGQHFRGNSQRLTTIHFTRINGYRFSRNYERKRTRPWRGLPLHPFATSEIMDRPPVTRSLFYPLYRVVFGQRSLAMLGINY